MLLSSTPTQGASESHLDCRGHQVVHQALQVAQQVRQVLQTDQDQANQQPYQVNQPVPQPARHATVPHHHHHHHQQHAHHATTR